MPKWHTNGPLAVPLGMTGATPFPHRLPSIPPPCPLPTLEVTPSVPFWHSPGCAGPSEAVGKCGAIEGSRGNTFVLTHRRVKAQREGSGQPGQLALGSRLAEWRYMPLRRISTLSPGASPLPRQRSAGRGLGRGAQTQWQPKAGAFRCDGLLSPALSSKGGEGESSASGSIRMRSCRWRLNGKICSKRLTRLSSLVACARVCLSNSSSC